MEIRDKQEGQLPQTFGPYLLTRRLGAGGMAEVFLAREPLPGGMSKLLVIKKIHATMARSSAFQKMFAEEARIAMNLNHPCVVQTFGYGEIGGSYYLAMEHVDGLDLLKLMYLARVRRRPVPLALAAYIVDQALKGLDYAHRKTDEHGVPLGIVHRDVSPQNILLSFDGAVKLADFGIARTVSTAEEAGVVKGKYAYMSPEQALGREVDRRADIFSAGVLLWEAATGRTLYGALSMRDALAAICSGQVLRPREVNEAVPAELEAIVMRALRFRAEDRYQTARDFHKELSRFFFSHSARTRAVVDSGQLALYMGRLLPPAERAAALKVEPPEVRTEGRPGQTSFLMRRDGLLGDSLARLRERRNVIILECAFSGLPETQRLVAEADARRLLQTFHGSAEALSYKHRAHLDRLDERGLTAILGLHGEGEQDAHDAVRLGLALLEALEGALADKPVWLPLALRIGIQRGVALVSHEDPGTSRPQSYELLGMTLRIARRLCECAQPGEVLVGSSVYRATRQAWRYAPAFLLDITDDAATPPMEVGGQMGNPQPSSRTEFSSSVSSAPSQAYRLLSPCSRWEQTGPRSGMWGRKQELLWLEEELVAARTGAARRCVLITGAAGIGKQTLLCAFRHSLDPARHLVLHALAHAAGGAYALLTDLARDFLSLSEQANEAEVACHMEAAARVLSDVGRDATRGGVDAILGALQVLLGASVGTPTEAASMRERCIEALSTLLGNLLGGRTLVLLVGGLQFVDTESLEVLDAASAHAPAGALWVLSGRTRSEWPEQVDRAMGRVPIARHIELGALSEEEQRALVRSYLPEGTSQEQAWPLWERLMERSGGNPFLLSEMMETLSDQGALLHGGKESCLTLGQGAAGLLLPTTVETLFAARLARLPARSREYLILLSLCERSAVRVDPALMDALLGERRREDLSHLTEQGMVTTRGDGSLTIESPFLGDVAYASLPEEERHMLHAQLMHFLSSEAKTHVAATDIALR